MPKVKMTIKYDTASAFVRGLTQMDVDRIRNQGRLGEVLRTIKHSAQKIVREAERAAEQEGADA